MNDQLCYKMPSEQAAAPPPRSICLVCVVMLRQYYSANIPMQIPYYEY